MLVAQGRERSEREVRGQRCQADGRFQTDSHDMRGLWFLFPEQYRIVAKVDKLKVLCNSLKVRIVDPQIIETHVADAIGVEQGLP